MNSLPEGYRAIVIGASGAIGSALARQLRADPRCASVLELGRGTTPAVDFDDEASVQAAAQAVASSGPFHCIINAAGVLHGADFRPERRLGELRYASMQTLLRVNAMGPAMVLAHFSALLPRRERGLLATLSARVGSIGDNRLGGWYSYRASKAALNMLVKTAAIELARTNPQAVVVALHPGTVLSKLSAPFGGEQIGRLPDDAATRLLLVLDGLTPDDSGEFHSHDGQKLQW